MVAMVKKAPSDFMPEVRISGKVRTHSSGRVVSTKECLSTGSSLRQSYDMYTKSDDISMYYREDDEPFMVEVEEEEGYEDEEVEGGNADDNARRKYLGEIRRYPCLNAEQKLNLSQRMSA